MNSFIVSQVKNMESTVEVFVRSCGFAAEQDDGKIDRAEEKQLAAIRKASEKYVKELRKIIENG